MKRRPRIYYTDAQKALMWERWQKGDSLAAIARLFDRNHSSVERILKESGGIRPPPRRRSVLALILSEREEISRGVVAGYPPSTKTYRAWNDSKENEGLFNIFPTPLFSLFSGAKTGRLPSK